MLVHNVGVGSASYLTTWLFNTSAPLGEKVCYICSKTFPCSCRVQHGGVVSLASVLCRHIERTEGFTSASEPLIISS